MNLTIQHVKSQHQQLSVIQLQIYNTNIYLSPVRYQSILPYSVKFADSFTPVSINERSKPKLRYALQHVMKQKTCCTNPQCTRPISHGAPFCERNMLQNDALRGICLMHCWICEMGISKLRFGGPFEPKQPPNSINASIPIWQCI